MELTGGLDNSGEKSGPQRVRGLGRKLETTRSLRDCGSLTASVSAPLQHLHVSLLDLCDL